ncbi:RNA-binding (RRM/RBD/RNP motifs) family protein [Striga asiatica]|uniref:RNA-binding (RRM/RBD/RNP motifs) family protein n=1 Tax=Striga asiatica TaxID=4170 RepID=A0A5A7RBZ9_STRAF|nr:RNA-binding (RRM/RBD/RNP motifs) family protein [Striga asiatica]
MARKRKTRATEAPEEPELIQQTEPEPQSEPEHPQPDGTMENEVPGAGDEAAKEEEKGEEKELEFERDGEEEQPDDMPEDKNEAVVDQMENGLASEITEKPSEVTVSEDGHGQKEVEELELEEEPIEKLLEPFSKDQLTLLIKEAVAQHPDVIESVHRLADADPAHCKIFVHGLGWEASAETITSAFAEYGEIEDCKVVKDKITGKSKGYGFILFKHRHGARRALKQPQKVIDGRLASCQLASAGPIQGSALASVSSVSGPPMSEYTQRKIYVSNVSAELDPSKLLEFFSKFGEIEEGPLGLDKQTGKPRGFCLFVYKNLESARNALEDPHKNFEGHSLHCQRAVDGPKHSKGGNSNQQFGQPYKQQHHQSHQGYYGHSLKKGKYGGSSSVGHAGGHLMAPSGGPPGIPAAGFNQAVAPEAIGQAVAALLATQGAGLGFGNLLGGIGAGVNPQGAPPPMMNNAGGYGGQPRMQGGYGGQQQMGQGGFRSHHGGAPYMGHGSDDEDESLAQFLESEVFSELSDQENIIHTLREEELVCQHRRLNKQYQ